MPALTNTATLVKHNQHGFAQIVPFVRRYMATSYALDNTSAFEQQADLERSRFMSVTNITGVNPAQVIHCQRTGAPIGVMFEDMLDDYISISLAPTHMRMSQETLNGMAARSPIAAFIDTMARNIFPRDALAEAIGGEVRDRYVARTELLAKLYAGAASDDNVTRHFYALLTFLDWSKAKGFSLQTEELRKAFLAGEYNLLAQTLTVWIERAYTNTIIQYCGFARVANACVGKTDGELCEILGALIDEAHYVRFRRQQSDISAAIGKHIAIMNAAREAAIGRVAIKPKSERDKKRALVDAMMREAFDEAFGGTDSAFDFTTTPEPAKPAAVVIRPSRPSLRDVARNAVNSAIAATLTGE